MVKEDRPATVYGRKIEEYPAASCRESPSVKEFCLISDSLANPANPISGISAALRQATDLALAVSVQKSLVISSASKLGNGHGLPSFSATIPEPASRTSPIRVA